MNITVYEKRNCTDCADTKQDLKARGLDFNVISLEDNLSTLKSFRERGFKQAPIVETDNEVWSGYNPLKIARLASSEDEDSIWE